MKALRSLMKKVRKGEGGFTLIELLIVIIILGILAAVVAFNVGGFLGAGTEQTGKTEFATVQTAVTSTMAACSVGTVAGSSNFHGSPSASGDNAQVNSTPASNGELSTYLQSDVHGYYAWGSDGVITDACYDGGNKKCEYSNTTSNWTCQSGTCGGPTG